MYFEIKELPPQIQRALRQVGYGRTDIDCEARDGEAPTGGLAGDGERAFLVLVDLAAGGRIEVHLGDWDGRNIFARKAADWVETAPMRPGVAYIRGTGGASMRWGKVYFHPSNMAPLLPAPTELDHRLRRILAVYRCIRGGARQPYLRRWGWTEADRDRLAELGLIKVNRSGAVTITTAGRNASDNVSYC